MITFNIRLLLATAVLSLAMTHALASDGKRPAASSAPLVSISTHDSFFASIKALCGKAFEGKLVVPATKVDDFEGRLVMHVRKCTETELQIPFHVGDDHSRTWIITKTGAGLMLKHDHRHRDGSHDTSTMYGGHTLDAGWNAVQSFPADQYSKELFIKTAIPQSVSNVWQMFIYQDVFSYRLIRESREFRVNFDLKQTVETPPTPWGYLD